MTVVDVASILDELKHEHDDDPSAVATTMTFLAYVDDPAIVTWMRERSRAIVEKVPSRLVLLDGTLDPSSHETHTIAQAEWVLIGTRGCNPEAIGSIAHAFTRPGVPTVLLWAGQRIADDPVFSALNGTADSLILDSSRIDSGVAQLAELTEYFARDRRFAVQDLAYLRLAPWQEMIAQFFDDPALTEELQLLVSVTITSGSQAEAEYLLGWLASRLGWKPGPAHRFSSGRGQAVTFEIHHEGGPRRVRRIELRSPSAMFRAQLESDDATVCLTVEGANAQPVRCEPLHDIAIVDLLERAILEPNTSDVYRATIEMVRALLATDA
ncbi:MAG TPA: OpcA/G6PD domain-containing protein [Candidatus Baltobacteraceae bacterium]